MVSLNSGHTGNIINECAQIDGNVELMHHVHLNLALIFALQMVENTLKMLFINNISIKKNVQLLLLKVCIFSMCPEFRKAYNILNKKI